nr:MAG TPA: hypothetical protein [Caudoviricetes sp.]
MPPPLSDCYSLTALRIVGIFNRDSRHSHLRQIVVFGTIGSNDLLYKRRGCSLGLCLCAFGAGHGALNTQNRDTLTDVVRNNLCRLGRVNLRRTAAVVIALRDRNRNTFLGNVQRLCSVVWHSASDLSAGHIRRLTKQDFCCTGSSIAGISILRARAHNLSTCFVMGFLAFRKVSRGNVITGQIHQDFAGRQNHFAIVLFSHLLYLQYILLYPRWGCLLVPLRWGTLTHYLS